MARTVGIGHQNFETVRVKNNFYVDKTEFIREWWESDDEVTLIARPRRFGKTLNMSMVEQFFSVDYAGRGDLFEGLSIWQHEKYRSLQGTYPVISISFANVKEVNYVNAKERICQLLTNLFVKHSYLIESKVLTDADRIFFNRFLSLDIRDTDATLALYQLSDYLYRYYEKKVIILLDEYDTPMQEAYVNGYWEELLSFTRSLFNSTFKTNPYMERAIMTGITRVSRESIFSDLNNLKVVTTTSSEYADSFGFTQEEVAAALEEYGQSEAMQEVKMWYDGFNFGERKDIYNPWSIINYLDTGKIAAYWANTSSNSLVAKLLREGSSDMKQKFEALLRGETLVTSIDEQIVYDQLDNDEHAIWSLLVASGYLKVQNFYAIDSGYDEGEFAYELVITNLEVKIMFRTMIRRWFRGVSSDYNGFVKALLSDDRKAMNAYMNRVALATFSYFDTGKRPSGAEPERFYHGFVLGLLVELSDRYIVTSNRESGFGRYDVMLEPIKKQDAAIIMEFKVLDPEEEKDLKETAHNALLQIDEKEYAVGLLTKGIPEDKIRKYGFAFEGKKVLIA